MFNLRMLTSSLLAVLLMFAMACSDDEEGTTQDPGPKKTEKLEDTVDPAPAPVVVESTTKLIENLKLSTDFPGDLLKAYNVNAQSICFQLVDKKGVTFLQLSKKDRNTACPATLVNQQSVVHEFRIKPFIDSIWHVINKFDGRMGVIFLTAVDKELASICTGLYEEICNVLGTRYMPRAGEAPGDNFEKIELLMQPAEDGDDDSKDKGKDSNDGSGDKIMPPASDNGDGGKTMPPASDNGSGGGRVMPPAK